MGKGTAAFRADGRGGIMYALGWLDMALKGYGGMDPREWECIIVAYCGSS